jgi:hypothetical protein
MRKAGSSWSDLKGRLQVLEDRPWLDEGRKRVHQLTVPGQSEPRPDYRTIDYSFQVARNPLRVRMTLVSDEFSGDDAQPAPNVIVRRGRAWWLRTGDVQESGDGLTRSVGLYGLDIMLSPEPFADFDYRYARTTQSGRPSILVSAEAPDIDQLYPSDMTVLSASRYEFEVDEELGIFLASRAYIEDRIASQIALRDVEADTAIDDSVFVMALRPE